MTIIKHGKFYSDKKEEHVDLYGKCSRCGCEFKTFVDLYWDAPEKGIITIITDPSCADMKVNPEFDHYEPEWVTGKFIMCSDIRLSTISGIINCPDCGELTELSMRCKEDLHGAV